MMTIVAVTGWLAAVALALVALRWRSRAYFAVRCAQYEQELRGSTRRGQYVPWPK